MRTIFYTFILGAIVSCNKQEAVSDETVAAVSLPAASKYADYKSKDEDAPKMAASTMRIDAVKFVQPVVNKTEQKIIRSADLKFQCDDLAKTNDRIIASVKKYGGYLQNDREAKEYSEVSRMIQVRIPSKDFDNFLKDVSDGVDYFDEKNISSEDVTDEYIDNESRVKTQKALENRYLELLKKANKVSEMLEIEEKLSEIREEIESKQARLNYLQTQVDMSSFTITFYKNMPQKESASVPFGSKIGNALKSGVNAVLDFFIWLLEMWPFIIILVALIVFFRKRWRRRQKN
ncbi:DUF4349 domain-containing protein [Flavobacterium sp. MAH-1]|uniref:DUF4349 domain-containing protein n=1 Tax=Flavobacterium agri TaxID=2743471 RepID=A0A7Y9C4P9_9FLAO|nr:DUF4349 domain-containing protein [Flavobacterium agri]NUY80085.1 DUF4349 domain-containing protein [Flavobacterium agri]NYA70110.1 DUF4349 domain-containing protein [Flavobacterium agri]